MKYKVSIVVPVYNSSAYLNNCIDSIIGQTYKNLEIILINDGSTDSSLNICNQYAKQDSRIKVFSKENGGLSSARNYGLSKCTGKYISFVDSDDFVSLDFIEILINNILKENCDLSVCGVKKVLNHEYINSVHNEKNILLNKKDAYNYLIMESSFAGYACNKMYKASIIKKMGSDLFNEYMVEDLEFNSRYLELCNRVVFTYDKLYFYFYNENGLTGSFKINDRILKGIHSYELVLKVFDKNKIEYSDYVAYYYLKYKLNINYRIHKLKYNQNIKIKDKKNYKRVMKSKLIKLKYKIKLFLSYNFPILSYSIKYMTKINK